MSFDSDTIQVSPPNMKRKRGGKKATLGRTKPSTIIDTSPKSQAAAPPPKKKQRLNGVINEAAYEHTEPPYAFTRPTRKEDALRSDLSSFGFQDGQVEFMMDQPETSWDTTMQRPWGQTRWERLKEKKELFAPPKERSAKTGANKYQHLYIGGRSDWVLYDPHAEYADMIEEIYLKGLPPVFREFSFYVPGNKRIVEYNLSSENLRLKSTPAILRGNRVEYTKAGPKLVEVKKPARGRPKKVSKAVDEKEQEQEKAVVEVSSDLEMEPAKDVPKPAEGLRNGAGAGRGRYRWRRRRALR